MRILAEQGDLTRTATDVVVNAANSSLLGGGGVDGALHAAAGPGLLAACREVRRTAWPGGLPVGEAVATGAFDLPAQWVVHTVGPNRHAGQTDPALLAACFRRSLDVSAELGSRSVAFPAVSGGVYGWAMSEVAQIAVATVREWAAGHPDGLDEVRFVLFSPSALAEFEVALRG
ncbi:O-acetyl-ADP-ribose deacetylase [Actinotalea sp. M2MS4P-6]|uniref:O-acetyl-ADP-ribose deacetylase n=1 Tax=Actinotalea sp. M2MS4P-6 TaxID=2983762 RepID=UPI0021E47CB5|nr:O-acetyl-ADP-ribose deacetylase [Actinotalea sp. M2MS4P-6]MCV2393198.1 O-acetyl-ADP-ribose deacetylase [Actinotalea sp. M2MS4P-6]